MDHSQFSHANKNEKFFSAVVKLLHKAEDNTHSKVQNTLEFKLTIAKKTTNMAKYATGSRKYARSHTTKNSQKIMELKWSHLVKTDLKNILTAYQILTMIKTKNSIAEIKMDAFTCRNKEDNKKPKELQRQH